MTTPLLPSDIAYYASANEVIPETDLSPVLEGVNLTGRINVDDETLIANIKHSIRLGFPQVCVQPVKNDRIALVGGGPSLNDTIEELRDLIFEGAKLVTVNGSYRWAIEHNFRPSAQVLIDARSFNSRFLEPAIPGCHYFLASQCHPDSWAAVMGRPNVGIFHACNPDTETAQKQVLDNYYLRNWQSTGGGSTVTTRAIGLLRILGYLRFDLFGVDSCWMGESNHAYEQGENANDSRIPIKVHPGDRTDLERSFVVSAWHLKQLEDILNWIRSPGHPFVWNVHGDGLIAYALQSTADLTITEE